MQQVEVSNRIWKIPLKEFFFQRLCKSITRAIQCHDKKNLKKIKYNFQHPHHLLAVSIQRLCGIFPPRLPARVKRRVRVNKHRQRAWMTDIETITKTKGFQVDSLSMEDGPAARRGSRQKAWLRESDPILTFTYWRVGEWGGKNKNKELKHTKKEKIIIINATSRRTTLLSRRYLEKNSAADRLDWIRRNVMESKYLG